MGINRALKGLFGLCQSKGCYQRSQYQIKAKLTKTGKPIGKAKLCEKCLNELIVNQSRRDAE